MIEGTCILILNTLVCSVLKQIDWLNLTNLVKLWNANLHCTRYNTTVKMQYGVITVLVRVDENQIEIFTD